MYEDKQLEEILRQRILADPYFALQVYMEEHESYQRMLKRFRILRQGLIESGHFSNEEEINDFIDGLIMIDKLNGKE